MWGEIAHSLQSGNLYLLVMMTLAFVGLIMLFERLIAISVVYNYNHQKFMEQMRKTIAAEDFDRARSICQSASKTSLPHIARKAIDAHVSDPEKAESALSEETLEFLPKVEARIGALASIATLVVLVGVLGTIDSLWQTFHALDVLDSEQKQALASQGVAQALNPTAMGVLVAILLIFGQQIIKSMASQLLDRVQFGVQVLHNLLVPKQVAYAMPAAGTAPMGLSGAVGAESFDAVDEVSDQVVDASGGRNHAAIDDTRVEDIKDEEEII